MNSLIIKTRRGKFYIFKPKIFGFGIETMTKIKMMPQLTAHKLIDVI